MPKAGRREAPSLPIFPMLAIITLKQLILKDKLFSKIIQVGFPGTLSFSDHLVKGGPQGLDARQLAAERGRYGPLCGAGPRRH